MEASTLLPVAEAAELVGKSRPALMKAIRKGRISATRDDFGRWLVDPAELTRVYPPVKPGSSNHSDEVADANRQVITGLQDQIALLKTQNEDLMRQRDLWQQQAHTLALTAPKAQVGFWRKIISG